MINNLTDAHAHIDDTTKDIKDICVCVSACFQTQWETLASVKNANILKAFGLHPQTSGNFDELIIKLETFLPKADALGEIGLDKNYIDTVSIDSQQALFESQIELSKKYNLPIIIHCVGVWGRLYDIIKKANLTKFLIHAANCSPEMVSNFEKLGGYFSFGLRELNSKKGSICAKSVSLDRILVESDGVSTSKVISDTIKRLSEIKNLSESELSKTINSNFNLFFNR